MRCDTCKHWAPPNDEQTWDDGFGWCNLIDEGGSAVDGPCTMKINGEYATYIELRVKPEHFCAMWARSGVEGL